MYRIADTKGTGKTSRLLLLAKENNGVVVCMHPEKMKEKAYQYGLTGIDYVSYGEYINFLTGYGSRTCVGRKIFIDELEFFLTNFSSDIAGYTVSLE
jgi:hypothetical protein